MFGMEFSCLVAMVLRVEVMSMGDMGVMGRFLMMAIFVRLGGFAMMLRSVVVMICGFVMMLQLLFVGHDVIYFEV